MVRGGHRLVSDTTPYIGMKKMSGEDYVLYDCPEPEIFFKK